MDGLYISLQGFVTDRYQVYGCGLENNSERWQSVKRGYFNVTQCGWCLLCDGVDGRGIHWQSACNVYFVNIRSVGDDILGHMIPIQYCSLESVSKLCEIEYHRDFVVVCYLWIESRSCVWSLGGIW